MQTRHICPNLEYDRSWLPPDIIYFDLSGWNLDDGHDGYIEIDYCPFCGVKLPKQ